MNIRANISLENGNLRCLWHPDESHLRHIQIGGVEILRGVYFAVRDANWGTVVPSVQDTGFEKASDGWRLWQDLHWREGPVDFEGRLEVKVLGTRQMQFCFEGRALSDFDSNRIGFLILHPAECAGGSVAVEKSGGGVEGGIFPSDIAPWQPFSDIRAITHNPADGMRVCVRMEGEVFEMEDQRNWTDASFKTYSTPLAEPFPRRILAGSRIAQQVTVSIQQTPDAPSITTEPQDVVVELMTAGRNLKLPALGFEDVPEEPVDLDALRRLRPDHLRVELYGCEPGWQRNWLAAVERAKAVGTALETALFLKHSAMTEIDAMVKILLDADVKHARWLVFDFDTKVTRVETLRAVCAACDRAGLKIPLFSGTDAFFTEINRERPPVDGAHGVVFSSNPSVHAVDDLSLVETLPILRLCVANAREFGAGAASVSPLTFKMRRNPNATTPEGFELPLPAQVDPRQWTPWGAAWTLGALKFLSEAGTRSVTCFKTTGPTGIIGNKGATEDSPLVELFRNLAEWKGSEVVPSVSSHPLEVLSLNLRQGERQIIFAANFSSASRTVAFSMDGQTMRRELQTGVTQFIW